ncbi:YD repeat-containing protein [Winogradskyella eximia]|uniref:YD repeat-containing protein n=1 Tax=Winogradskyella eximia TaxID=262006 RepID=A0A3D9HCV6_9FLAO|nr:hypothetical protein [Winogradskyella eximia]RED47319.1 YD repeat-containing protein [Winogradskyella eximia]
MKKLIFIFCAFGLMLNSCSSDDSSDDDGGDPDTVLLQTLIETYEGEDYITNFTYSGNKLIGTSDNDGYSEEYIYTGELLTTIKEYEDGVLDFQTELGYDSSNRLITETFTFGSSSVDVNTFTYNADGTITLSEDGVNTYILTYASNGNRIEEEDVDGGQDYTFTYDTKNNPLKNIHQREVFELIGNYAYENNVLDEVNTGNTAFADESSFTYTYNSANYPTSGVETITLDTGGEEDYILQYIYE